MQLAEAGVENMLNLWLGTLWQPHLPRCEVKVLKGNNGEVPTIRVLHLTSFVI
jgi:hypothetical protein